MKTRAGMLCVLSLVTMSVVAQEIHVPTPSTWKLNLAKSDNGDLPQVRSQTVTFLKDTTDKLIFHEVWTDSRGKKGLASFNGPEDGTVHSFVRSKVKGSFTPAGTGRFFDEDGGVSDCQLAVSPGAKTLVMTTVYKAKDGPEHHMKSVFDRVRRGVADALQPARSQSPRRQ